jgi:uncharacterized membrane protein YgcG
MNKRFKISQTILGLLMMFLTFCMLSIKVSANDAYFLGIAFDADSKSYLGTIAFESNNVSGGNHTETSTLGCGFAQAVKDGDKIPEIDYDGADISEDTLKSDWADWIDTSYDNDKELLFSFPGYHTKGVITAKLDADATDEMLAERIANTVIPQLNACLTFIAEQCDYTDATAGQWRVMARKVGNAVKSGKEKDATIASSITVNGQTVSFSALSTSDASDAAVLKDLPSGIFQEDYVKVTANGKTAYFIFQAYKGYVYPSEDVKSQDPYARDTGTGNWYEKVGKEGVQKIGWNAIVAQGNYNADLNGVSFSNLGDIMPTSAVVSVLGTVCNWIVTTTRSFLGLYGFDELMLNKGTRSITYSMGLFPNSWIAPIYLLYVICTMIVWAVMGFAVIQMLMKRQLATVNVGEKINMMNEIKNLLVCCFLLGAFPFVFNMLARINYSLVQLFGASTQFTNNIKSFYTLSVGSFGSILACGMGLILQIYFNFFYILRAITLAILYGIAPLAIYTIVLGGKHSKVFGAWSKELMSNIFVQTLHAIMISFFTSVQASSGLKTFESLVVLYSFIPLTKFVKQNVFQASEGLGGAASSLTSMAGGAASAAAGSIAGGGESKGGGSSYSKGSSGGGSGYGGTGAGMMSDKMNQINGKAAAHAGAGLLKKDGGDNTIGARSQGNVPDATIPPATKEPGFFGKVANIGSGISYKENPYTYANGGVEDRGHPANPQNRPLQTIYDSSKTVGKRGGSIRAGVMSGIGNTARAGAGMLAVGAGMGLSSIGDSAGGARLMKEGMGNTARAVGNFKDQVTAKQDKPFIDALKNNGIKKFSTDGTYDYGEMGISISADGMNMSYDEKVYSKAQADNILRDYQAINGYNDKMSDAERQWRIAQCAARGISYQKAPAGSGTGNIVDVDNNGKPKEGTVNDSRICVRFDRTSSEYQKNGVNMISATPKPYVERPQKDADAGANGGGDAGGAPYDVSPHLTKKQNQMFNGYNDEEKASVTNTMQAITTAHPDYNDAQIMKEACTNEEYKDSKLADLYKGSGSYTEKNTSVPDQMKQAKGQSNPAPASNPSPAPEPAPNPSPAPSNPAPAPAPEKSGSSIPSNAKISS